MSHATSRITIEYLLPIGILIASIILPLIAIRGAVFSIRSISRQMETPTTETTLEVIIGELSKTMEASAQLIGRIQAELEARATAVRKLEVDAGTAEMLAAINSDQAQAIRRLLDAELHNTTGRIRRDSVIISISSFVAGAGVTILVTLLVHPLH